MSAQSGPDGDRGWTTITVERDLHDRLNAFKPFDSTSYNDIIADMADVYEEERS